MVNLSWRANPEPDLAYYAIYRDTASDFMMADTIDYTADTTYCDTTVQNGQTYYYKISAFDFSGNESEHSDTVSCIPVSVPYDGQSAELPQVFSLSQNYPNPFNPITEIRYTLPRECWVKLEVYNILGQKVATLVDGEQKAGYQTAKWGASSFSSGIYFYRLRAGNFVQTRKMILLK